MEPADLPDLPALPGCYLFRDAGRTPIYVGKARSLKARVRTYFQDPSRLTPKVRAMVAHAASVETITTGSEVEALLLENTLIKRHRPRYNILLRDDKTYPYVKMTAETFPRLLLVRRVRDDGARYYGPFPNAGAVRDTLRLLRRLFPMRTCTPHKFQTATRPCLEYHIHRCGAPCTGLIDALAYGQIVESVRDFLDGHPEAVRQRLDQEMRQASESLAFERAAELRDLLRAMERLTERQEVVRLDGNDEDYVNVARQGRTAAVAVLQVRAGTLVGRETYFLTADPETSDAEVLGSFLGQYYPIATSWPRELVVPTDAFESADAVRALLRTPPESGSEPYRGHRRATRLITAQRGARVRLLSLAAENAAWAVRDEVLKEEARGTPLDELRIALNLPETPWRIEGYDISNFQGTDSVSSMVVFEGGRPQKSEYRHFRIRTVVGANDFASHAETIRRRFERAREEQAGIGRGELSPAKARFARMPDLLLIDGGKGQLSAVRAVLHEMGLEGIPTFGLAKREELLFEEGRPDPIRLPRSSPALRLLQAVRDESHRFAITYHRTLRSKRTLTSELLEVPGIGADRAKKLLKAFGSLDAIAQASEEALREAGLPRPVAQRLAATLATGVGKAHHQQEEERKGANGG